MKVSLNTVQSLINFELPPVDELVARINAQLGGVEEVIDLGAKYNDALIVKVVECEKHPNADKLSVCKIDDGGVRQGVERNENGLVQVVCGAPNVTAGMWAVWLPPESVVPSSFDDAEPFRLGARELRGVLSQGMLAAGDELAINSNHDGIVSIVEADLPSGQRLQAGASFAEAFGLNDTIIDIENKMFTHRPDLFGQLGVAREIAGIFGHQFTSPEWYLAKPEFVEASGLELEVFNGAGVNAPRFMAVAMSGVDVRPSPLWLQAELVRWGSKPISNVVDITNWIMLFTAQPTHAYDYDKLRGGKIGVRMARDGETIRLLNDKTYQLTTDDIVIADGESAIGLAGIMGGADSEVDENTKNIVLEVANFDMYAVRRSAMRHGLFTDALTRFNKGQSAFQTDHIFGKMIQLIEQLSQASQASDVYDEFGFDIGLLQQDQIYRYGFVGAPSGFVESRLGVSLERSEQAKLLQNVECKVDIDSDETTVYVPFWRTDLELPEDIVEEVGRLYGFDKLPRELPRRSTKPAPKNALRQAKQAIRESLSRHGANEVLTYSFVHEKTFTKAEQDSSQAFKLSNALSPDLQYYRLTVLPSLLDKVHMNIKAGHDEFVLFEIGKGHNKKYQATNDNGLPGEIHFVDLVYASKKPDQGAPYYHVRRLVQQLCQDHGLTLRYKPITEPLDYPVTAPFDLKRSATLETQDGTFIGMIGELKQSVIKNFKLPSYCAAATLDLEGLAKAIDQPRQTYAPLSKFPSISQDISLKVSSEVSYDELSRTVYTSATQDDSIDVGMTPITIYQPDDDASTKTITFRLQFSSHTKTLNDADIKPLIDAVSASARSQFNAEVV